MFLRLERRVSKRGVGMFLRLERRVSKRAIMSPGGWGGLGTRLQWSRSKDKEGGN